MALSQAAISTAFQNVLQRAPSASELNSYFAASQSGALSDSQVYTAIITSPEAAAGTFSVTRFYQAAFGRVPDQAGLDQQVDTYNVNGNNLKAIAVGFTNSTEFTNRYGTDGTVTVAYLQALYVNVLGRTGSSAEIQNWLNAVATPGSGYSTRADVLFGFAQSGEFIQNSNTGVINFLTGAAQGQNVYSGPLPVTGNVGTTFALTVGLDTINGTAGNDTINAVVDADTAANNTLSTSDVINGGAGKDTLNVTFDIDAASANVALPAATFNGVENFYLRNVSTKDSSAIDFGTITGEEQVWNDRSTSAVTVTNLASGTVLGIQGSGSAVAATTASYVDAATAASILVSGGAATGTGAVTVTGNGLTSATLTSQSGANTLGGLSLASTIKTVNVVANSDVTTGTITGVGTDSTLNISGGSKANVGTLATNFTTVNASGNSGGVTITLDGDTNTKFTGGTGNDTVTLGAAALTTGSVDGGAGTGDKLVANGTNLDTATTGAKYTNFEILRSTGGTVNLDNISGITSLELNGGNVSNVTAAQAAAIKVISGATYTIDVKGASTVGQIDTVALTVDDGATAKNTINLATPVLTGVEKLSVNAVDNSTIGALTSATSLTEITLSGAGDHTVTTGAVNLGANATINAGASSGTNSIDASAAQGAGASTGFSITGGTGIDNIFGTQKGDVISGGAGNDILFGRGGADTIVGGDGNDIIQGDGTSTAVAEVQTFTITQGSDADGGVLLVGGAEVTLTANQNVDAVGAAIAAAQTAIKTANTNVDTVTYNAVNDTVTVTYKNTAGDVGNITVADKVTNPANATGVTTGAVQEATKGALVGVNLQEAGDGANADILTGGAGNDTFRFAAGTTTATATDTITDLNLGTDAAAGKVDGLQFQNAGATVTIVALSNGQQASVTAASTLTNALGVVANAAQADGATVQFTFGTDTYIFHNGDGNATYDTAADFVVKVTGVVGTLDLSDISVTA